jgi:hypothetical protein
MEGGFVKDSINGNIIPTEPKENGPAWTDLKRSIS